MLRAFPVFFPAGSGMNLAPLCASASEKKMASSLVKVRTSSGQTYVYSVDAKTGKKTRVPATKKLLWQLSRAEPPPQSPPSVSLPSARPSEGKRRRSPRRGARGESKTPQKHESEGGRAEGAEGADADYESDRDSQRDRMAEHCTYIAAVARLVGLTDAAALGRRALLLRTAWRDATDTVACERIVPSMRRLKEDTRESLVREKAVRCYVELMKHMLRELDDFQAFLADPDFFRRRQAPQHVADLAAEDAEAQLFVACDVPTLVRSRSPLLDTVVREGVDLALQLHALAKRALAVNAARSRRSAHHDRDDFLLDVLPAYIELRAKHVTGARAFVAEVLPKLDMSADLAELVRQLVVHEIRESDLGLSIVQRTATSPT